MCRETRIMCKALESKRRKIVQRLMGRIYEPLLVPMLNRILRSTCTSLSDARGASERFKSVGEAQPREKGTLMRTLFSWLGWPDLRTVACANAQPNLALNLHKPIRCPRGIGAVQIGGRSPAKRKGYADAYPFLLAGMAGFEPTSARVKVWCLTAWRHPNNSYIISRLWRRVKPFFDKLLKSWQIVRQNRTVSCQHFEFML